MNHNNKPAPFVNMAGTIAVNTVHRKEFDVPVPSCTNGGDYKYQCVQGGCEYKGRLYTFMVTSGKIYPQKCCIVTQDLSTGKQLAVSDEYSFGHANDATFNPHENTMVVCFCDETTRMAILDADTLELKCVKEIEGKVPCNVHYVAELKTYVVCGFQNESIYLYDKDLNFIRKFPAFMTKADGKDFIMQGVISDGTYAYVLEWLGGNVNRSNFNVFELDTGKHVGVIDLNIPLEIEYAVYVDGKFLVGCNNKSWSGLEIHEVAIRS